MLINCCIEKEMFAFNFARNFLSLWYISRLKMDVVLLTGVQQSNRNRPLPIE